MNKTYKIFTLLLILCFAVTACNSIKNDNCIVPKTVSKESKDWTCSCGTVNSGNFCGNCGKSKPTFKNEDWTCSCGILNKTNFCTNCGKQKGEKQSPLSSSNPFENAKVGDCVKFGNYPQTANGEIQPIEWQVLGRGDFGGVYKMLVISKYALEFGYFDGSSNDWNSSYIRTWLNDDFYNKAFTDKEKSYISSYDPYDEEEGNIFLLSKEEAETFFAYNNSIKCKPTEYAMKKNDVKTTAKIDNNGYCIWWLRSHNPDMNGRVYRVLWDDIDDYEPCLNDEFIRPALWINLESLK